MEHIILEFVITNTISDQLLVNTCINLECADCAETYNILTTVNAPVLRCGALRSQNLLVSVPTLACKVLLLEHGLYYTVMLTLCLVLLPDTWLSLSLRS
jgi:hypothetical protein